MLNNKSKGKKPYECPVCKAQFTKLDSRHLDTNVHKAKLVELGITKNEDPAISYFKPRKTSTASIKKVQVENCDEKVGKNYEELFEKNIIRHPNLFLSAPIDIHKIIQDIENKLILVPRIQRNVLWTRDKIKELIISLYEGTPIGTLTFWRLSSDSEHVTQYRSILKSEREELGKTIHLILDGLQRISSIAAVYSKNLVVISENFRDLDLYYNFFTDRFEFKEDIDNLDLTWINLKESYVSSGYDMKLKEKYKTKINPILDRISPDMSSEINERINRLFSILAINTELEVYKGQDYNFAHNLLVKRNLGTKISALDLLYSVISGLHPEMRLIIEDFSEYTLNTLGIRFKLTVHDILHLAIHLINPGTYYSYSNKSMSRISSLTFALEDINKKIREITKNDTFKECINILEDAIGALLPNGGGEVTQWFKESKKNQQSNITIFKKKSSFYACYCIYLFCNQYQQKKEFHQFLGRYFIYNILLKRFSKRERSLMLDLHTLNDASKDFKSLRRKMFDELNPLFWTEILPQKFLVTRARFSDLSMLYQLTLIQQPVFNGTNITVKSFLLSRDVKFVGWIKIFHKSWFNKTTIDPASILNKIAINYTNQSKRKFEREELWGWLKDIMLDNGISYANGMFDSWDFPRGFEEEMEEFHKKEEQHQIVEYLNDFFEKRAKKIAISIKKTFFLNGVN